MEKEALLKKSEREIKIEIITAAFNTVKDNGFEVPNIDKHIEALQDFSDEELDALTDYISKITRK